MIFGICAQVGAESREKYPSSYERKYLVVVVVEDHQQRQIGDRVRVCGRETSVRPSIRPRLRFRWPHAYQINDLSRPAELAELMGLVELIVPERAAARDALCCRNLGSGS